MNAEETLRDSIKKTLVKFCKDEDIPWVWPVESDFERHYKRYRQQGFGVVESRKWAYERSQ